MQHLGIPTYQLSTTHTTIYDFNANGTRLMGKIKPVVKLGTEIRGDMLCH